MNEIRKNVQRELVKGKKVEGRGRIGCKRGGGI